MNLKNIAKQVVPRGVRNAMKFVLSSDYRDRRFWEKDRQVGEMVHAATGGLVVAGPFKGLKYVSTARGSSVGPKLLGTYEMELRAIIEAIIARGYQTVVNIGAGEGYYSVGLAKRMPDTRFVCFDSEPLNQEQIRTLAQLNGVDGQMDVRGACDDAALAEAIGDARDVLVICDIEGAEVEVLGPESAAGLRRADLLVEMHDIIRPGCSAAIRSRFETSHKILVIPTRPRNGNDFPPNVKLHPRQILTCMEEWRGSTPMTFFWMRARNPV